MQFNGFLPKKKYFKLRLFHPTVKNESASFQQSGIISLQSLKPEE